jgi:mRNA interferase MazF
MRIKEIRPDWHFRRGDIYMVNLNPFIGSEQGGTRPVLVLQNNDGNLYCPTLIVAPMTTQLKKLNQPTHYLIRHNPALAAPSMVEFEQITTIDKSRIIGYIGKLTKEQMMEIEDYLKVSLGIYIACAVEAP